MIIFETVFYITQGFETRDMIPLLRSNALSGMTPFQKNSLHFFFSGMKLMHLTSHLTITLLAR
jgi:hypothetical protein